MKDPQLQKKFQDWEYQRRVDRSFGQHFLTLLPLLVYAAVSYWELRYVSVLAINATAATYAIVLAVLCWQLKRQTVSALRREGVVDDSYQPPDY